MMHRVTHHHHHHHHRSLSRQLIFLDVPSDITIDVNGVRFALHKFPLVTRSGRIRKLISEHRDAADTAKIELLNLPGGPETFQLAAKFCYGINFEITTANVAQLCCASDYLEMTEEYADGNLSSRSEAYLDDVVCRSLEMCVQVLQQCETLLPLADELKIVSRCTDAIASKACAEQIASSFSRLEYSSGRLHMNKQVKCGEDWWIQDLSVLRIDLYQRVIEAMKCRGVRPESIGASLVDCAEKLLKRKPVLGARAGASAEAIEREEKTGLPDLERKRLCKLIDFHKLSEEASGHAAQNERLPLQAIVQVLYIEQLRLRNALCCSCSEEDRKTAPQSRSTSNGMFSAGLSPRDNYASLRRENRELKLELARMRLRLSDLEKGHACIKQDLEKSNSRKLILSVSKRFRKLKLI
ncbi:hypothetical protein BHM03_00026802 [Ensete ventricosum]|uniref:NPH3 domain-containing protein n=1 Tax=Ensete ventricosum TaxID=4639 RepID=A0A445MHE9_ENSVE|nr:hypothetical protein BHM03_00026802 [Ensete ventricosum]